MKISHGCRFERTGSQNGYGYATDRMIDALTKLGHEVNQNDPTAPVQIWFDQPHHWKWNDSDQYRIGYHPWESTLLKPGWAKLMNECDEIWTPSPLLADWYVTYAGIKKPVYVYEHGVDPVWTPEHRKVEDKFRFLHMGAEAARKGGYELMRAFRKGFQNRDDVELTLKMINPGWNIPVIGKTNIVNRTVALPQLVSLFHEHHAYVYPSWGEGFGLTPLQAMATGMPTITVPDWAPYAHYLDPRLNIKAKTHASQWPMLHPGKMFSPSIDDTIDHMRWVVDNYDSAQEFAHSQIPAITAEYDWLRQTEETFNALQGRINL
jgi:glycosyltransferase involved in cell wall biosynthesis